MNGIYKRQSKTLLLLVSLLLLGGNVICHGQTQKGAIKGLVRSERGSPLPYANVTVKETILGTNADEKGEFEISGIEAKNHTIVVTAFGFETQELIVEVKAGETTYMPDITLKDGIMVLNEVILNKPNEKFDADFPSNSLRLQGPLVEVPQNIQVVTEEVIEDQQAIDMLETVSRNVSGAQMIEHWGNFARINIRGFNAAAFRNGMNVQMPWGPLTEDMSIVERIEFVKGPAGFLLSSGEPGGIYNVVTKKPTRLQQNEISLTAGSFNTLRGTVDVGGKLKKDGSLLYRFNVMGLTKGSHRAYEFNNRFTIAPSVKYELSPRTSVTAEYIYQYSQMSVVGAAYVFSPNGFGDLPRDFTFAEPNIDPTNINEHNLFLNLNHRFNEKWNLTAQVGYLNYLQIGSSLWPKSVDSAGNVIRGISVWDALNESKLGQVFLTGNITTGPVHHAILAGLDIGQKDYFADWFQGGPLSNVPFNIYNPKYGVPSDSMPVFDRSQSIRKRAYGSYPAITGQRYSSLYMQDELGFLDNKIRFTAGGRYTYFHGWSYGRTTKDRVLSPRFATSVTVAKNTSVYGLYDQSFLPQTGADIEGNAFVPVRANNIEAGVKKEWSKKGWNSTFAVYQITKENVLTANPENPLFSIQLGEVRSRGFEFDLQGEIVKGLKVILNYANTNVIVTEDTKTELVGTRVAGHAKHMTNAWFSYQFQGKQLEGIGLSAGYQYQVDRSSWNWGAGNESILPDYFRLDGAVHYEKDNYRIALNVNNILNDYLYSGSAYSSYFYWQTEPGINYRLNLTYKF